MLNLLAIVPGQVLRLKDGSSAEVTENIGDGIWLNARGADGMEELVFCEDIASVEPALAQQAHGRTLRHRQGVGAFAGGLVQALGDHAPAPKALLPRHQHVGRGLVEAQSATAQAFCAVDCSGDC